MEGLEKKHLFLTYKSLWDHSFGASAKFSEKLTILTPLYAHMCAY